MFKPKSPEVKAEAEAEFKDTEGAFDKAVEELKKTKAIADTV
jgi:hypothetical protein